MQAKKIAIACAAAFAGLAAGTAHAALTTDQTAVLNDANTNHRVVYLSGASAVQKGFQSIISTLFQPGAYYFAESTKGTGSDYVAVAGKLAAARGTWSAGTNVIFIERFKGGSDFGVNTVAQQTPVEVLDVTAGTCGASGGDGSSYANAIICSLNTPPSVGGTGTGLAADAGVSDVAPQFFKNPINTSGEPAAPSLNAADLAKLHSTPIYGLMFAPAVTNNVPTTVTFNKSLVASIMAGNVYTWDKVDPSLTATLAAAGASTDIVICRRVPGSGTQAVFNMYLNNFPCSGNFNPPLDRDSVGATWTGSQYDLSSPIGGPQVIENSTSGDVKACLNAAAAGTDFVTHDRNGHAVNVVFGGQKYAAIGVLSMDSLGDSHSGAWTFRNLDGAGAITWTGVATDAPVTGGTGRAPSMANYLAGKWDMQGWESFNMPNFTTGNKLAVLNAFLATAQAPATITGVTALMNVAASVPSPYSSQTPHFTAGVQDNQVLRAAYLNGNQCAPYTVNY